MITRTWACLNRHCQHVFDSTGGDYPPCTKCGGIKTKWVPKPFGIKTERTQNIDNDVKQLQAVYGDKNYQSPLRGERMAPRLNPIATPGKTMPFQPMPGWQAQVPVDQAGNPLTYCTTTGVTAKVAPALGTRAPTATLGDKQLGVGGRFEGSWRPPGGIPR